MIPADKPAVPAEAVKWRVPDLHPEGRKYVAIAAAIVLLAWVFVPILTWPLIGVTLWVAVIFRDPVRVTPVTSTPNAARRSPIFFPIVP